MKYAVILMFLLPLMSPLNAQSLATQSIGSAGFAGPAAGTNKLYWNVGEVIVGLGTNGSQLNQGFFQYFDLSTALHDPDYNHNLISAWPNPATDVIYLKSVVQEKLSLSILDANGKLLMQNLDLYASETNEINTAQLPSAQYYLLISKGSAINQLIKIQILR